MHTSQYKSKQHIILLSHLVGDNRSVNLILSMNVNQKSLETEFLIAICRPTGDKWQLKTLILAVFDLHYSIVKSVFDCRLPGVIIHFGGLLLKAIHAELLVCMYEILSNISSSLGICI